MLETKQKILHSCVRTAICIIITAARAGCCGCQHGRQSRSFWSLNLLLLQNYLLFLSCWAAFCWTFANNNCNCLRDTPLWLKRLFWSLHLSTDNLYRPEPLYTLRSPIEGYTCLLIFRKFSILPAIIWASPFINIQENVQPFCFSPTHMKFFPSSPLLLEPTRLSNLDKNSSLPFF